MKSDTQYAIDVIDRAKRTLQERGKLYSGNQNKTARIMAILFEGMNPLDTVDNTERYKLITHIVEKLSRYCLNFKRGGHSDSALDGGNYFFLLAGTDDRIKDDYARKVND